MRYEGGRKPVRILIVLDRILHTKEAPNGFVRCFLLFPANSVRKIPDPQQPYGDQSKKIVEISG